MCGIFGIFSAKKIDVSKLTKISNVIKHRGPDDSGYLLINNLEQESFVSDDSISNTNLRHIQTSYSNSYNSAFIHRRLSIIETSAFGHQPMSYFSNQLWITFNGEIYNYIELKKELEDEGYNFVSKSDTEVILASYHKWGENCVKKFNGMWAFAIWDKTKNIFFLSRDRFGVKPLFYYFKNNEFLFSSEIKGIKEYLNTSLTINKNQLVEFGFNGQIKNGCQETVFEDIFQLKPGHNLIFKENEFIIYKYWEIILNEIKNSFEYNIEEFTKLFRTSLKYRLRSDVPIGSCLSGGIDSSSIVSYVAQEFNQQINTFSAIWPGKKCDESKYIDLVNLKHNCIAHKFVPSFEEEINNLIEQQIWHQEIPLSGSSLIAQWAVMEKAKKTGVKVLLDGQGADEILSGYPRYIIPYINELIFNGKWKTFLNQYPEFKKNGYDLKRIIGMQKNKLFSKSFSLYPLKQETLNNYTTSKNYYKYNSLPEYLKHEIDESCLPSLLHVEDRNSMAHGIETRLPFLDYKLAEYCINIPSEQKIHGTLTKVILRNAMRNVLPIGIYTRRDKIGFETPIESFLKKYPNKLKPITKHSISYLKDLNVFENVIFEKNNLLTDFRLYSLTKFIDKWT